MPRSIVIFGNGLGMALAPNYFALSNGLESVWNNTNLLSQEHKTLIVSAIEGTTPEAPPSSEDQLDKLQVAIIAADFLRRLDIGETSWLTDQAKELPSAFKQYIHEVAIHFHNSGQKLPAKFLSPLSDYIKTTKSHVCTLNYDNLLYDGLRDTKVLDGYRGPLIDGFWREGFDDDHLERKIMSEHGWYMHLHGSPLFTGNQKTMRDERLFLDAKIDSHITKYQY